MGSPAKRFLILAMLLAVFVAVETRTARAEDPPPASASPVAGVDTSKSGSKDADKKDQDVSGGHFAGDPVYVHLAPMILPVITDTGAEQIVTLQIAIEVKDFDAADSVHTNMPRVMDALMRVLYGGLGNGNLRNGQLVDVDKIKTSATSAVGEVIGADNIRNVLIEAIAQRRL
jgi:flagellar basal body-associated protein FliL